jgi:hypothetical protein
VQLKNLATGDTLVLPDDLLWLDEHSWSPTVAAVSYLITGALVVQTATRQAGRPITLAGAVDMGWVSRATVTTLEAWAAFPLTETQGRFQLLVPDGRLFTVAFRHADAALEAEPVTGFPARHDTDFYRITLRLMEL